MNAVISLQSSRLKALVSGVFLLLAGLFQPAVAQEDGVWVQIEAHPTLTQARTRAAEYAAELADVNGFALRGGWYAIALGPYARADAEQVLRVYRAERQIPRDSFIAFSRSFREQYWPGDAGQLQPSVLNSPALSGLQTPAAPRPEATINPALADETAAEARLGERRLTRQDKRKLQTALRAQGFYRAAIDGSFGGGTRRAMAAWQEANGAEPTGILTTAQRRVLMDQFNAPLLSVGMARVVDEKAGISLNLPTSQVAFERYNAPFAQYNSTGDLGARVLLISQPGDQATLLGLFEIMQTLEVVPRDGPRRRAGNSFVLEGRNARVVSHSEARLLNGQIKGFTLIWPSNDEARRARVLADMQASFEWLPAVLDPGEGDDTTQDIDLISGLEIRKPLVARSGFFISDSGAVVTTSEAVAQCGQITLDNEFEAELVAQDDGLGVAILRPKAPLAPISVAELSPDIPRLKSDLAVSGYSFEGILGGPTLTYGTLADIKGLRGETELKRLALSALPGDAGGPVLDSGGAVVGMLLPRASDAQQLPRDVNLAASAQAIRNVLEAAGLSSSLRARGDTLDPEDLADLADGMTVLVSCWE